MFLVNSRLGLFSATSSGSGGKLLHPTEAPLLPRLRGQLAEFLGEVSLDRLSILYLPTCVGCEYGHQVTWLEAFLGSVGSATSPRLRGSSSRLRVSEGTDLPIPSSYTLKRGRPSPRWPTLLRHPIARNGAWWCRNINRLSFGYAFRPHLRSRLTLGGLSFPRSPWAFGVRDSHPDLATHAGIRTSLQSTEAHASTSSRRERSPTA